MTYQTELTIAALSASPKPIALVLVEIPAA
jgi:hypothetical protein